MPSLLKEASNLMKDWNRTRRSPVLKTNYLDDPVTLSRTHILIDDPENLKSKFNLTDQVIISLAGGLPTADYEIAEFEARSEPGDVIKTTLSFDFGIDASGQRRYGRVDRTLDLKKMMIYNDVMIIQKQGTGIGTNIIINQLTQAIASSFSSILVTAAGPDSTPPPYYPFRWDGYKTWIKFGYLLEAHYDTLYRNWAGLNSLNENSLNKLYFRHLNYKLWETDGFTWKGSIELKNSRTSILLFKLYLLKKNINVPLSEIALPEFPALLAQRISLSRNK